GAGAVNRLALDLVGDLSKDGGLALGELRERRPIVRARRIGHAGQLQQRRVQGRVTLSRFVRRRIIARIVGVVGIGLRLRPGKSRSRRVRRLGRGWGGVGRGYWRRRRGGFRGQL